jgi:polyribonucleotide nucleotidyltransferase
MEAAEKAKQMISEITAEAEVGKTYTGKVVRIEDYGAFVEILPNLVGLMHISEIAHYRVKSVRDVLKLGQTVSVKVLNIEDDNKIKLSMKALEENPNPEGSGGSHDDGNRDRESGDKRSRGSHGGQRSDRKGRF